MWHCPQCGAWQDPDDIRTVEIVEPGKGPRVEFHGKIRPIYDRHRIYDANLIAYMDHSFLRFSCLVCNHTWPDFDPEDPTPGGASVEFLHPVLEVEDELDIDRDAC